MSHRTKPTQFVLPSGRTVQIPSGIPAFPADDLPPDSKIKYWLGEATLQWDAPELWEDPEFESFQRNYGIGLHEDEVEFFLHPLLDAPIIGYTNDKRAVRRRPEGGSPFFVVLDQSHRIFRIDVEEGSFDLLK